MVEWQLRGAASTTSVCSPRWGACRASSFSRRSWRGRIRRRRAADRRRADDLAAVHGRAHLRAARAAWWRAGARRRHRLGLSGRGARRARRRGAHDRTDPGARGGARANLAAAGYEDRVHLHVGDGTRGVPEQRPSPQSPSQPPRSRRRPPSTTSSSPAAASSSRWAAPTASGSRSSCEPRRARPSCAPFPAASCRWSRAGS